MGPERYVLDSSAMFSLIEDEDGADRVEEVIRQGGAILPFLVLLEVLYVSQRQCGTAEANRRYSLMRRLPCDIVWTTDEPTLLAAAGFKARFRLSLADALIAAYAKGRGAILLHKDPELEVLAGQLSLEALPYKANVR